MGSLAQMMGMEGRLCQVVGSAQLLAVSAEAACARTRSPQPPSCAAAATLSARAAAPAAPAAGALTCSRRGRHNSSCTSLPVGLIGPNRLLTSCASNPHLPPCIRRKPPPAPPHVCPRTGDRPAARLRGCAQHPEPDMGARIRERQGAGAACRCVRSIRCSPERHSMHPMI